MDPVEAYLDQVARRLRGDAADARRLLAELESHLLDEVDAARAEGLDDAAARERALARIGSVRTVARAANGGTRDLLAALMTSAAGLAVVGFAAILTGTLVAELLGHVFSMHAFYGLPGDVNPAAAKVAGWLADQPSATNWHQAATLENADDTLLLRGGASLIGLIGSLVAYAWLRRRHRGLPIAVVGATAFGIVGLALVFGGVTGSYTAAEWGTGKWLTDGLVALTVAMAYAGTAARRALA